MPDSIETSRVVKQEIIGEHGRYIKLTRKPRLNHPGIHPEDGLPMRIGRWFSSLLPKVKGGH